MQKKKDESKKILGVIGGMGPAASMLFYDMIITDTDAERDQDHVDMIILNHASMPDRTSAIEEGNIEELISLISEDIRYLEEGGAEVIAIPCNTSHSFLDSLQKGTKTIIVNMIECAAKRAKERGMKRVGILATDGTIKMDLYKEACEKHGIEAIYPDKETQRLVMKIIYEDVKQGKTARTADFATIEEALKKQGCDGIILGCTELSVCKKRLSLSDDYIDAMAAMATECIGICGYRAK